MRFFEIKTIKPITTDQNRINNLKHRKDQASTALKAEQDRQKKQKALANIQKNNEVLSKLNSL